MQLNGTQKTARLLITGQNDAPATHGIVNFKTTDMLLVSKLPEYQQFDMLLGLKPSDAAHEGGQCMQLCPIDCKL